MMIPYQKTNYGKSRTLVLSAWRADPWCTGIQDTVMVK